MRSPDRCARSRASYAANLAAIDVYAQAKKGAPFAKLAAPDQDSVLTDMEKNVATGFSPNAAAFFTLVRTHTIQGTFCDPYYGGNANFVGWDLIGYPGIRLAVTADEQRMKARAKPERASAYADAGFAMNGATQGRRPWPSTLRRPTSSSSGSARSAASPRCRSRARAST